VHGCGRVASIAAAIRLTDRLRFRGDDLLDGSLGSVATTRSMDCSYGDGR